MSSDEALPPPLAPEGLDEPSAGSSPRSTSRSPSPVSPQNIQQDIPPNLETRSNAGAPRREARPRQPTPLPLGPPLLTWIDRRREESRGGADAGQFSQPLRKPEAQKPTPRQARDIVRLFQCKRCSRLFKDAVTLSCGRSLCRTCLPDPSDPDAPMCETRTGHRRVFKCIFGGCERRHSLEDCHIDVVLNKAIRIMDDAIIRCRSQPTELCASTSTYTRIMHHGHFRDGPEPPPDTSMVPCVIKGEHLVALWTLVAEGHLSYDADVKYRESSMTPGPEAADGASVDFESLVLHEAKQKMRMEMDCEICYSILYEPMTSTCGHTFCRPCLLRIIDHSGLCPLCRSNLDFSPLLRRWLCPVNERLLDITTAFWRDELVVREEAIEAELAVWQQTLDVPLFSCTVTFPTMPTFLHVFEPSYRLMIRRALDGGKAFGIVLPREPGPAHAAKFFELGTLVRIVRAEFYPDGRILIETTGLSRFRVVAHGQMDGYPIGKLQRVDDMSLEEEAAVEALEVGYDGGAQLDSSRHDADAELPGDGSFAEFPDDDGGTGGRAAAAPTTVSDLETMTTKSLMQFAVGFVERKRGESAPWLTERMLFLYGDRPSDAALLPWWLASILPVKNVEKYRLLGTSSVRQRLKICGEWILEMGGGRW
ncbi:hypothetical protein DCS_03972 [Drechmeria coniospora]|uniref:ATP-dependent protease La domain-containing protein n=1 Tax=Drechmeria coniospora TaxID=98403 RepID=A0A151GIP9_DRECN|nr:hypothetical protein DCS_03972 [Drechmeria coniospora]KYK56966.1 hypothetical protein DCS_03972 [Drechmeria coniospora]